MIAAPSRLLRSTAPLACFALVSLAFAACSNDVDDSPNNLPYADASVEAEGDGDAGSCACLAVGQTYRFDSLQIASIDKKDTAAVIQQLNPLWLADIQRHELNFYVQFKEVAADSVTLDIINGARLVNTSDICTLESTRATVKLKRKGCEFTNYEPTADGGYTLTADPAALNVYAGTPANPKNCTPFLTPPHSIAVRNAAFRGRIKEDCSALLDGTLAEGVIPKATIEGTCTCLLLGANNLAEQCGTPDATFKREGTPNDINACTGCNKNFQSLNSLLITFNSGKPLDYLCKDEQGVPGVCLSATFDGTTATLPADCPAQ